MIQESATFIQVLFNLLLWILIFFLFKKSYDPPYNVSPIRRKVGIILILVFCLFAFWGGDYFHYLEAFTYYNKTGDVNQEKVYEWLYGTFSFSYTALRLAIWGGALFFLLWAYRRISYSFDLTLFVFGTCFLPIFSYARASLSMSMILLGLSFIVLSEKKWLLSMIFGLFLLGTSVFFHKSAPIGIAMAIASLFLINANKVKLFLVAVIAPLIVLAMQQAFDIFAVIDLSSDTFIAEHYRDRYLDIEYNEVGRLAIGPFINSLVSRVPSYLIAFLYIVLAWTGDLKKLSVGVRAFASYAFCVTLLSVFFSFDFGYATNVLQYRTLYYALPASAVFLSGVRYTGLKPKLFKPLFYLAVFSGFYQVLYAAYCALVA